MSYDDIELIHCERVNHSAVLLFHGLTGSPYEMKKYAKYLYENGYDVYCYALPGHGGHYISIYNVKYQDWLEFASEKYRCLRGFYNNFFVGGLCLGALLALYLAQRFKTVSGLICLSSTLYLDGWTIPKYNFLLPLGLYTILRHYYTFMEREPYGVKNKITRKKIEKLMKNNTVALDNYPLSAIYELLKLSKLVKNNLQSISVPVLIIHSKEDDLTSIKSANEIYDSILSKIKEKIILNNSYHLILYDNEKEYVFRKSIEFLNMLDKFNNFPVIRKFKEVIVK